MQNNFNLDRPEKGQKSPHNGVYVITDDQLPLFPLPPQKAQNSPFQGVYGPNQHRVIIQKAAKFIKNHKKS